MIFVNWEADLAREDRSKLRNKGKVFLFWFVSKKLFTELFQYPKNCVLGSEVHVWSHYCRESYTDRIAKSTLTYRDDSQCFDYTIRRSCIAGQVYKYTEHQHKQFIVRQIALVVTAFN